MDDARIPILFDDEVAIEASAANDGRGNPATVEADGTLRIVLPIANPCTAGGAKEIVVCGKAPELEAENQPPPDPAPSQQLAIHLGKNASLAPGVSVGQGPAGGSGVEAKITLKIVF